METKDKERKNNYFKVIAIVALVLSILSLSAAYASLTSKLKFNVDSTQAAGESVIKWDKIVSIDSIGYASPGELSIIQDGKTVTGNFGTVIAPGDRLMAKWTLINTDIYNDQDLTIEPINLTCIPAAANGSTIQEAEIVCQNLSVSLSVDGWGNITNSPNVFTLKKGEIKNAVLTLTLADEFNTSLSGTVIVLINKISIS